MKSHWATHSPRATGQLKEEEKSAEEKLWSLPGDTSADPVDEPESRRQSLRPLVTPGLSPQPWWASRCQITQPPEKERHLQHGVKTALPEREETWAHLRSGIQIQQGVPASVISFLGSLRQRKGEIPLVKPWEWRGRVNGCGRSTGR